MQPPTAWIDKHRIEGIKLQIQNVLNQTVGKNYVMSKFSRRLISLIIVAVHPLIQVRNQLVGAPVNTDVTLQCHVEASPKAINYWTRETGEYILEKTHMRMLDALIIAI